jgi:hypothetical protein
VDVKEKEDLKIYTDSQEFSNYEEKNINTLENFDLTVKENEIDDKY